jgi:glycosidase
LIALRNSYPALAIGALKISEESFPEQIMAYSRTTADQELFVIHNLGSEELEVALPKGFDTALFTLGKGEIQSGKLKLGANSSVVLNN